MTTIRDTSAPVIVAETRPQNPDNRGTGIVMFLIASAILMTFMNLAAAVYLYRTSGKVALVQKQLGEITNLEQRMKSRLELVNTGIQSQFDILNTNMPARFNEVKVGIARLEKGVEALQTGIVSGIDRANEAGPEAQPDIIDPVVALEEEPPAAPVRIKRQKVNSPPPPSPSYQRVETAEGKVYYRKIR